jgi:hypothetical protein
MLVDITLEDQQALLTRNTKHFSGILGGARCLPPRPCQSRCP